jgi:hypothetical protein
VKNLEDTYMDSKMTKEFVTGGLGAWRRLGILVKLGFSGLGGDYGSDISQQQ